MPTSLPLQAVLSAAEMREADRQAIAAGIPAETLMENAGAEVANIVASRYKPRKTLVICGGGNNGGDGFVAARQLKQKGWDVSVAIVVAKESIGGDAQKAMMKWLAAGGSVTSFHGGMLDNVSLVLDAIFGVGIARPVEGMARQAIEQVALRRVAVVAIDLPSGVHADTGEIMGVAFAAECTVTFFRPKLGLFLVPGRAYAGEVLVAQIGIPDSVLAQTPPRCMLNGPEQWLDLLPFPTLATHKYDRGHAVVVGGTIGFTGAAKLAANAALRAGAGLVSIAAGSAALPIYATSQTSVMVKPADTIAELELVAGDPRVKAILIGPGSGINDRTREQVLSLLAFNKPLVVDADAITVFKDGPQKLFKALHPHCVLTPHDGEFARLFPTKGSKPERAIAAARQCGAIVLLKGSDTVIAHPKGYAIINHNAPPWLATAGSGDVLGGIIAGLITQGMDSFLAACAGAWIHGDAAARLGFGMISEDLPWQIPATLSALFASLNSPAKEGGA
jgi:hydroxyethylthiazole kinase-like uncharacterized protein yjeF